MKKCVNASGDRDREPPDRLRRSAHAKRILEGDKDGRLKLYEKLGLPPDPSIR